MEETFRVCTLATPSGCIRKKKIEGIRYYQCCFDCPETGCKCRCLNNPEKCGLVSTRDKILCPRANGKGI